MRNTLAFSFASFLCITYALPQAIQETPISPYKAENNALSTGADMTIGIQSKSLNEQHDIGDARGKKNKGMMEQMYMMVMMSKAFISSLLMFVGPIIQFKGLILGLISVLINLGRFIIYLKEYKQRQESTGWSSPWQQDRIGHEPMFPKLPAGMIKRISVKQ